MSIKAIETVVEADDKGEAQLRIPVKLTPGQHKVLLVIETKDEAVAGAKSLEVDGMRFLEVPPHDSRSWKKGSFMSREDFYEDGER